MSQIKLKRLSFRVRWENAAKGGLAECPKELLRKQTRKTARQTDRETYRCADKETNGETAAARITYTQRAMTTTKKLPTRCY